MTFLMNGFGLVGPGLAQLEGSIMSNRIRIPRRIRIVVVVAVIVSVLAAAGVGVVHLQWRGQQQEAARRVATSKSDVVKDMQADLNFAGDRLRDWTADGGANLELSDAEIFNDGMVAELRPSRPRNGTFGSWGHTPLFLPRYQGYLTGSNEMSVYAHAGNFCLSASNLDVMLAGPRIYYDSAAGGLQPIGHSCPSTRSPDAVSILESDGPNS